MEVYCVWEKWFGGHTYLEGIFFRKETANNIAEKRMKEQIDRRNYLHFTVTEEKLN
jgi:hypothetical protein